MHGKQTKSINFSTFKTMMDTGHFKKRMHKSFLGFLYWTGVRISEALLRVKEDFSYDPDDSNILVVSAPALKKGFQWRELRIDVDLPFMDLVVETWKKTRKGKRIWPFTPRTGERVVKRAMGPQYYPHFLRLNRVVQFLDDPSTTPPEMKGWFGWKDIASMNPYVGFSKKHVDAQRKRLHKVLES